MAAHISGTLHGAGEDAGWVARPRALSERSSSHPRFSLRQVSHDRPGGVLQPRRPVDARYRKILCRGATGRAVLCDVATARLENCRVHLDAALYAYKPSGHAWLGL